jgi:hypothetical protein
VPFSAQSSHAPQVSIVPAFYEWHISCEGYPTAMHLPEEYRDGWMKFPVRPAALPAFKEGAKGRLYFLVPNLRPGAVDASVWRIDGDGVVFRFEGPAVASCPLSAIPQDRQIPLSSGWVWTWETARAATVDR